MGGVERQRDLPINLIGLTRFMERLKSFSRLAHDLKERSTRTTPHLRDAVKGVKDHEKD